MKIVFLPSPEGDVIAWEEQFDQREGRFILCPSGSVTYRHPANDHEWLAGISVAQFWAAAEAWNDYSAAVTHIPDSEQKMMVKRLREELARVGVLNSHPDSLWRVLLEQAEGGML